MALLHRIQLIACCVCVMLTIHTNCSSLQERPLQANLGTTRTPNREAAGASDLAAAASVAASVVDVEPMEAAPAAASVVDVEPMETGLQQYSWLATLVARAAASHAKTQVTGHLKNLVFPSGAEQSLWEQVRDNAADESDHTLISHRYDASRARIKTLETVLDRYRNAMPTEMAVLLSVLTNHALMLVYELEEFRYENLELAKVAAGVYVGVMRERAQFGIDIFAGGEGEDNTEQWRAELGEAVAERNAFFGSAKLEAAWREWRMAKMSCDKQRFETSIEVPGTTDPIFIITSGVRTWVRDSITDSREEFFEELHTDDVSFFQSDCDRIIQEWLDADWAHFWHEYDPREHLTALLDFEVVSVTPVPPMLAPTRPSTNPGHNSSRGGASLKSWNPLTKTLAASAASVFLLAVVAPSTNPGHNSSHNGASLKSWNPLTKTLAASAAGVFLLAGVAAALCCITPPSRKEAAARQIPKSDAGCEFEAAASETPEGIGREAAVCDNALV